MTPLDLDCVRVRPYGGHDISLGEVQRSTYRQNNNKHVVTQAHDPFHLKRNQKMKNKRQETRVVKQ